MKNNKQKKTMTAIQYGRNLDKIMAQMESIGAKTIESNTAMMESMDDELFNMDNLLDVNVQDEESTQPQLFNQGPKELNEGDKALVVEELAKVLMRMPGDIIDFSDIGPIATAVQSTLGFTQSLHGYIEELMSGATDKQNSQQFAKGTEVPGIEDSTQIAPAAPVNADKAPTEIAPTTKPIEDAPSTEMGAPMPSIDPMGSAIPSMDAPIDAPLDVPAMDAPIDAPAMDAPIDAPLDTPAPTDGSDLVDPDTLTPSTTDGLDSLEDDTLSLDKNPIEDDVDEDDKKLDAQLESIKSEFFAADREKKIASLLESIEKQKPQIETQLESITKEFHATEQKKAREKALDAQLESIVSEVKKDKEVDVKLESLISNFKALTEAKVKETGTKFVATKKPTEAPAVAKIKSKVDPDAELNVKLESLIESYQVSSKQVKLESITARQKAREAISRLTK